MDNKVSSVLFLLGLLLIIWLNRTGKLAAIKELIRTGPPADGPQTYDTPYGPIYGHKNGTKYPRKVDTPYGPVYGVPN